MNPTQFVRHVPFLMDDPTPEPEPYESPDIAEAVERAWTLKNMSAPPKTVVKFEGLRELNARRQPGGADVTDADHGSERLFGTPVRFVLSPKVRHLGASSLLRLLDPTSSKRSPLSCETRLAELLDARAGALPLPEGCLLITSSRSHAVLWDDDLTTLAVLTKCTDTVWLRGRTPSLASARERGAVTLLVPPAFAARLPEPIAVATQVANGARHGQ